ncbi:MAG: hypothetical protein M0C28_29955 [Candidatus Moduliflexus flocculans]|nr:hypothetical protein [Candidatus Moduliflexus flocculans]
MLVEIPNRTADVGAIKGAVQTRTDELNLTVRFMDVSWKLRELGQPEREGPAHRHIVGKAHYSVSDPVRLCPRSWRITA